jgi:hypothetical protein
VGKTFGFARDSVQVSDLKRSETSVPNPRDSGVDNVFPPRFHVLMLHSSSGHVCLSPIDGAVLMM